MIIRIKYLIIKRPSESKLIKISSVLDMIYPRINLIYTDFQENHKLILYGMYSKKNWVLHQKKLKLIYDKTLKLFSLFLHRNFNQLL